jgi:hypothetical protein
MTSRKIKHAMNATAAMTGVYMLVESLSVFLAPPEHEDDRLTMSEVNSHAIRFLMGSFMCLYSLNGLLRNFLTINFLEDVDPRGIASMGGLFRVRRRLALPRFTEAELPDLEVGSHSSCAPAA